MGTSGLSGVRLGVLVAAVVTAVAVSLGVAWVLADPDTQDKQDVSMSQPQSTTEPQRQSPESTAPPVDPDAAPELASVNPQLDAAYMQCARDRGFDPGGVQVVVVASTRRPYWVKTARDVPAAIHEPCMTGIGGPTQRHSSHGTPP